MKAVVFCDLVGSTGLFERLGNEAASRFVTQLMGVLGQTFALHKGRVVKTLGDGLFVVFEAESAAVSACVAIQRQLHERPIVPGGAGTPVELQMGIASGEVVEIEGDCYGDAVNSAARLADLAGAQQILTTAQVREALEVDASGFAPLGAETHSKVHSLGALFLRGKGESTEVFRVQWLQEAADEATVMGVSLKTSGRAAKTLEVVGPAGEIQRVHLPSERLTIGRTGSAGMIVADPRVSRMHVCIEARGNQFVLIDTSSYGTWLYAGGGDPQVLRRGEAALVGAGYFVLGCDAKADNPPLLKYAVTHPAG
jgi:adenylate cyclase